MNQGVAHRVHARGGLVEHQHDLGVECSRPGQRDKLLLPDGEVGPALGQHRVPAVGQAGDELIGADLAGRGLDLGP